MNYNIIYKNFFFFIFIFLSNFAMLKMKKLMLYRSITNYCQDLKTLEKAVYKTSDITTATNSFLQMD